jgi:hypothetical protein
MICAADCGGISYATAGAALRAKTVFPSRPRLPGAVDAIFEAHQLLGTDRPSGVAFAGGDADLGAEAELAAIGELRRGVVQHDRRVDLVEELRAALASSVTIASVWCEP